MAGVNRKVTSTGCEVFAGEYRTSVSQNAPTAVQDSTFTAGMRDTSSHVDPDAIVIFALYRETPWGGILTPPVDGMVTLMRVLGATRESAVSFRLCVPYTQLADTIPAGSEVMPVMLSFVIPVNPGKCTLQYR
jgi:hypothetical protein